MAKRPKFRLQALLLRDGKRASQIIQSGLKPRDALMVIGGSRARMYRAMTMYLSQKCDTVDELLS